MPIYLRTDEAVEAVRASETTAECAGRVRDDLYQWRWVVVSLHNALQGFMVLALRGTEGLFPLRPDVMKKWLEAYEAGDDPPQEKLDTYLGLYKKIKREGCMCRVVGARAFTPEGSQGRSVKKLNSLRNDFVHFLPRSWSLELTGLPGICLDCLGVVEFLGWESNTINWYAQQDLRSAARRALDLAAERLAEARDEYLSRNRDADEAP